MSRGGEAALISGTTDELFGYFESLDEAESIEESEAMSGNGDVKAFEHTTKRIRYTGRYIWRTDTLSPTAEVGTGDTIILADSEIGNTIYITSATKSRSIGGGFMAVDFEGIKYPSLGT